MPKSPKRKDVGCYHCGKALKRADDYMVHDKTWKESGLPSRHPAYFVLLHKECLEERIGRKLTREDFADCLVNLENGLL